MIWILSFFSFFLYNLKSVLFFSSTFYLESAGLFMCCISPLVLFLILGMVLIFSTYNGNLIYNFNFILLVSIVSLTFLVSDCLLFLILLELTVFPMAYLIFSLSKDSDKVSSILFMMLINLLGSLPFMIFLWFFYMNMGSNLFMFGLNLSVCSSMFLCFCFSLVLICKLPFFLIHFWLTKAHVSASGSCSMLLASLMLKLGSFGLLKFSPLFFFSKQVFSSIIFSTSLIGSFILTMVMIRFFDMKFLIACSSILHMSTIFPFLLFGHLVGKISSLFMMTGHGLVSYFLFLIVTLCYEGSFNRSFDFNKSLESFNKFLSMFIFIF